MKSTNVPSNSKENQEVNNPSLFSGQTRSDENGNMEMPPKAASTGISEKAIKIAEANGEIIDIPAGNCRVKENNTMELENGTIKKMKSQNAYSNINADNKTRNTMKEKAKQKNNREQAEVETVETR